MWRLIGFVVLIGALIGTMQSVQAIRADECEQQRALYPTNWNDVSNEKALFKCVALFWSVADLYRCP